MNYGCFFFNFGVTKLAKKNQSEIYLIDGVPRSSTSLATDNSVYKCIIRLIRAYLN